MEHRAQSFDMGYLALLDERAFAEALNATRSLLPAVIDVAWPGETGGPVEASAPSGEILPLAFDHSDILAMAIQRLRGKLDYSDVAFALLPERFTLRQLQDVYEAILGASLNKPAFRRRTRTPSIGPWWRPCSIPAKR